ncbi:MAG: hypothetical protein EZS28_023640 [Streblomastix strix]|uniref:Uncharacterized protein n=1 Tax=Streblomastix strix TaxID=222440 RepID=A0A5J4VEK9_9EUKA|nr:MAG: hypothetical protein EZS28_023640 [Streblomastix strix]
MVARSLFGISSFANSVVAYCLIEYADAPKIFNSLNGLSKYLATSAIGSEGKRPHYLEEILDPYLSFSVPSPISFLLTQGKGIWNIESLVLYTVTGPVKSVLSIFSVL